MIDEATAARFWSRVRRGNFIDCWPWLGVLDTSGYGKLSVKNKSIRAHRIAYQLTYGDIPDGLFVCHTCDNRLCCNPYHLFLGTNSDNIRDAVAKGRVIPPSISRPDRIARGERIGAAKLTAQHIAAIRARHEQGAEIKMLAAEFNVTYQNILAIVRRKSWRHLQ